MYVSTMKQNMVNLGIKLYDFKLKFFKLFLLVKTLHIIIIIIRIM